MRPTRGNSVERRIGALKDYPLKTLVGVSLRCRGTISAYAETPIESGLEKMAENLIFTMSKEAMQETLTSCMGGRTYRREAIGVAIMAKKRAALYVRVSTDHQSNQNQITELTDYAERKGWHVVETYSDEGISGTKGRNERAGLDQMLKDATRHKFDVVAVWALDRLGRSLPVVFQTVETLKDAGVGFYIQKFMGDDPVDTTSPQGELIFLIFAGIARFERAQMLQRQKVGIKRARAAGVKFGRPQIDYTVEKQIKAALAKGGMGMLKIADKYGVGSGTVQRIKAELAG